jgi:hypothetical protein
MRRRLNGCASRRVRFSALQGVPPLAESSMMLLGGEEVVEEEAVVVWVAVVVVVRARGGAVVRGGVAGEVGAGAADAVEAGVSVAGTGM